jgi:hypothetical protein
LLWHSMAAVRPAKTCTPADGSVTEDVPDME